MPAERDPSVNRKASPRRVPQLLQLGCAHVLGLLIVTGVLLVVDTMVVSAAYQSWLELGSKRPPDPRIAQTVLIIGPLLLLFVQYWLYDRIRDFLLRPKLEKDP